jgi:Fe-S-cluster containining protein
MDVVKEGKPGRTPVEVGVYLPSTPEERFVKALYSSVDETIACGLDRLFNDDGIVPTCRLGCCHCCRFPILVSIAEVRTLAQFVKRTFSPEQIEGLRMRTQQWHQWDDSMRGRSFPAPMAGQADDSLDTIPCPMLAKGECSVYDVRPLVCRTHFVFSDPLSCKRANDLKSAEAPPRVIDSIKAATGPYSTAMKEYIEKAGLDYCRSMTLLPHGIAIEMGWDFDKKQ